MIITPADIASQAADLANQASVLAQNAADLAVHNAPAVPFVYLFTIFVLAIFVGYYVVWSVTPALHSPLMAVTNAVSSVIIVGALLAAYRAGLTDPPAVLAALQARAAADGPAPEAVLCRIATAQAEAEASHLSPG